MTKTIEIVFALFPGLTQLDFTGPFEVLQRLPGARVRIASREGGSLTADSGLCFAGLERLADIASADVICVPGGYGLTQGEHVAQRIQLSIEYDPAPPFPAGSPDTAPAAVLAEVRERVALQYPERRAALAAALASRAGTPRSE